MPKIRFHPVRPGPVAGVLLIAGLTIGLTVGLADRATARRRPTVESQLTLARSATARIPADLTSGDPEAVAADLDTLIRSAAAADRRSSGLAWRLAGWAGPQTGRIRDLRRAAVAGAELAAAAGPLRNSLTPLRAVPTDRDSNTSTSTSTSTDQSGDLDELDDLARNLSQFAITALRRHDPAAPALERTAIAAGLLPTLAGAEAPRVWTICRNPGGPCRHATVSAGALGPVRRAEPPRPGDLVVIGVDPAAVFGARRSPRHRPEATIFALLCGLGPDRARDSRTHRPASVRLRSGVESIRLRSGVRVEQHAIDQLSRPGP